MIETVFILDVVKCESVSAVSLYTSDECDDDVSGEYDM